MLKPLQYPWKADQWQHTVIHEVFAFFPAPAGQDAIQQSPVLFDLLFLIREQCHAIKGRHDSQPQG